MTPISDVVIRDPTGPTVQARFSIAVGSSKLAIVSVIIVRTQAAVSCLSGRTYSAILTGRTITKVYLHFAMTSHITGFAIAVIIVNKLYAVLSTRSSARIG